MAKLTANRIGDIRKAVNFTRILKMTPQKWMKIGRKAVSYIREDARRGHLQGDIEVDRYRSRQYINYKSKGMRRKDGKRLKGQYAQKITSTRTDKVDLTLTGDMINSLRPVKSSQLGVEIAVGSEHIGKVVGNRRYGREILSLHKGNQRKVKLDILNVIDKNLRSWAKDRIVINIG